MASEHEPSEGVAAQTRRGVLREWITEGTLVASLTGAGVGLWAAQVTRLLNKEVEVLVAVMGAAIGLLAVSLTAMTLVIVFLGDKLFGVVIWQLNVRRFFRPFVVVAMVSGAAAAVSLIGAIEHASGPTWLKDVLFGISVWLFVWAILGAVGLVFVLVGWASDQADARALAEDDPEWTPPSFTSAQAIPDTLTPREIEVLKLLARGLSDSEIAAALFVSSRAVQTHVGQILRKLGAGNRAQAVRYARDHRLA